MRTVTVTEKEIRDAFGPVSRDSPIALEVVAVLFYKDNIKKGLLKAAAHIKTKEKSKKRGKK